MKDVLTGMKFVVPILGALVIIALIEMHIKPLFYLLSIIWMICLFLSVAALIGWLSNLSNEDRNYKQAKGNNDV